MKKITIILTFLTASFYSFAQDNLTEAKTYFSKYLNTNNFMEDWIKALPTLEECKLVFKGTNADSCFNYIEEMKSKMKVETGTPFYVDLQVESFTTVDILQGKGNYTGGMGKIGDRLQKDIVFYKIELLKTKGAENGMAYNYWVKLNGRWVWFPKPWRAFK